MIKYNNIFNINFNIKKKKKIKIIIIYILKNITYFDLWIRISKSPNSNSIQNCFQIRYKQINYFESDITWSYAHVSSPLKLEDKNGFEQRWILPDRWINTLRIFFYIYA